MSRQVLCPFLNWAVGLQLLSVGLSMLWILDPYPELGFEPV